MRWLLIGMIVVGCFSFCLCLLVAGNYEAKATMVQFVRGGTQLVGEPIAVILPPGAKKIKGTGPKNSTFIAEESVNKDEAVPLTAYLSVVSLARLSAIGLIVLGSVGLWVEGWYRRTMTILAGANPLQ